MARLTRWAAEVGGDGAREYAARMRRLGAEGADLAGEARLVDAVIPRRSRVLDAGCGTGRVGAELHARGHRVVGVDADPVLVAAAQEDHPGPTWVVADLTEVDPAAYGGAGSFDAAVAAGNVLVYAAPGSVSEVVAAVAAHLRPGGVLVTGFSTGEHYAPADLDHDAASVGLALEQRFATWDLRPWHEGADWVVSLHRRPDGHVDAGANV